MKQFIAALGTVSAIALATTAFAADGPNNTTEYKAKDNGGYSVESKSDVTTRAGTDKKGSEKVDVTVDDNGRVSKEIKSEGSADPKGLMNAKSNTHEETYKQKDNGGWKGKAVTEHKNAAGTNTKTEVETDVEVNADGTVDKTVEKTKIVDPKGLMNKQKTTTKTVNGRVVD